MSSFVRANAVAGSVEHFIAGTDTTLKSSGFQDLPAIDPDNEEKARIFLQEEDDSGRYVKYEIMHVVEHSEGSNKVVVERGREGTAPKSWDKYSTWKHGPTAEELDHLYEQLGKLGEPTPPKEHGNEAHVEEYATVDYVDSQIEDLDFDVDDLEIDDIDGLQSELDGKSDTGHTHTTSDIDDFDDSDYASVDHSHEIDDVDLLQLALDSKSDVGHTHEVDDIDDFDPEDYVENSVLGQPDGVATLDSSGYVPSDQLDIDMSIEGVDGLEDEIDSIHDRIDGRVATADKGAPGGVAELDGGGEVPRGQLPDFEIEHVDGLQSVLDDKVDTSEKGEPDGVATLDGSGHVPSSQLDLDISHVDGLSSALDDKIHTSQKGEPDGVATLDSDGQLESSQLPDLHLDASDVEGVAEEDHTHEIGDVSGLESYVESEIEDHRENEVHDSPQPPQDHGNESHSESFLIGSGLANVFVQDQEPSLSDSSEGDLWFNPDEAGEDDAELALSDLSDLDADGQRVTGLGDPEDDQDAATRGFANATYVASEGVRTMKVVTESEYDNLDPPDPETFYIVVEDD